MSIFLFCEGQTEINVVKKFATLANPQIKGEGKAQVNKKMRQTLGPLLGKGIAICTLIMYDVDEGEMPERIVQSVTDAIRKMLKKRDL